MKNTYKTLWMKYSNLTDGCNVGDFWKIIFIHLSIYILLFVSLAFGAGIGHSYGNSIFSSIIVVGSLALSASYFLITSLPTLTLTIRRLNNAGLHWEALFIFFIPYAGPFILAFCLTLPAKETRMSYSCR